jgi:endonuclease I
VFEVRKEARGDIARSMFYVATMYNLEIPEHEEKALRAWHKQDPVSKEERERNDRVAKHQKSRNPYVDYPNLTNRIKNF